MSRTAAVSTSADSLEPHRSTAVGSNHSPISPPSKDDLTPKPRSAGFLFSPTIDLIFIANLFWPAILLVDGLGGIDVHESLLFWQIYFITAPHRWITLILVGLDRERTANRGALFGGLAIGILAITLCLRFGTGSLLCLGVVDYVWNAWHFSSQHHGIFRIYERRRIGKGPAGKVSLEKILFRGFLLYVIARVAGVGWSEGPFLGSEWLQYADGFLLAIPLLLVLRQATRTWRSPAGSVAGLCYLTSVMALFTSMLLAAHWEKGQLVLQLALASAIFHSFEYLSIVTWSVQQSRERSQRESPAALFSYLSQMWVLFLIIFVVVIGVGNYLLSRGLFEFWVLINIVVAFWHYLFDGMIWKRRPKPAKPVVSVGGTQ